MLTPPDRFTCVECSGTAHLIGFLPDDGVVEAGTALAYRCSDCNDRFDVIWEEGDENPSLAPDVA